LNFKKTILKILLFLLLCTPAWSIHFSDSLMKPPLGRVPYWPAFEQPIFLGLFTEGAGSRVNDLSGNRKDGTLTNGPTWDVGKYGSAIRLSGSEVTEDHIDIGDYSLYEFGDAVNDRPFTFIVGYIPDSTTVEHPLVVKADTTVDGVLEYSFALRVDSGLEPYIQLFDAAATKRLRRYGTPISNPTSFHQFAATYDGSKAAAGIILYVDGLVNVSSDESQLPYIAMHSTSAHLRIGANFYDHETYDEFADGRFEYVMIFNRALSNSEIAYLYRTNWPWFAPRNEWWGGITVTTAGGQIIIINMN